jgi:hypothetical protein
VKRPTNSAQGHGCGGHALDHDFFLSFFISFHGWFETSSDEDEHQRPLSLSKQEDGDGASLPVGMKISA